MTRSALNTVFLIASALAGAWSAYSGPVTTVPWNGHTGAVSFTYDDARSSQIPNLLPQLDALKIKATFFISATGTGGNFEARKTDWIQAAKNGHELANHTKSHVNVPADPDASSIISEMAKYLRALDPTVESLTFAYPNCNVNGKTGISSENFISRSCGQNNFAWASQPTDWMSVPGLILTPTNVNTAITMLNTAKSGNSWVSTIVHDVKEDPDSYSLTPADNKKMIDAAVANNLWIDTYQNVAAYYRAHFVMDAATESLIDAGWGLTWTSPHPKMPKSVKLRVKLAAATFGSKFTVQQTGVTILPEADGSYVIDFMKLSLKVIQGTSGVKSLALFPDKLFAHRMRNGIAFSGVRGEVEATVVNVDGTKLFQGPVMNGVVPLAEGSGHGLLFLTLRDRMGGGTRRVVVQDMQ